MTPLEEGSDQPHFLRHPLAAINEPFAEVRKSGQVSDFLLGAAGGPPYFFSCGGQEVRSGQRFFSSMQQGFAVIFFICHNSLLSAWIRLSCSAGLSPRHRGGSIALAVGWRCFEAVESDRDGRTVGNAKAATCPLGRYRGPSTKDEVISSAGVAKWRPFWTRRSTSPSAMAAHSVRKPPGANRIDPRLHSNPIHVAGSKAQFAAQLESPERVSLHSQPPCRLE